MGKYNRPTKPKKEVINASVTTPVKSLQQQAAEVAQEVQAKVNAPRVAAKKKALKKETKNLKKFAKTLKASDKPITSKTVKKAKKTIEQLPAPIKTTSMIIPRRGKVQQASTIIKNKVEEGTIGQDLGDRFPTWSFAGVWNQSFNDEERPTEPRSHLWASELGKAPVDVFLSLKGVQPTNPPNERSKRKFEAGDVWEWIVELVLRRAGILVDKQVYVKKAIPGMLEVTGRLDHLAGGKPDWEKAQKELKELYLPPFIQVRAENIVKDLAAKFPKGLKNIILEVKSTSSFMFEVYEKKNRGSENHEMQIWHYLNGKDIDEGQIPYICRDDARIHTIPVWLDDKRIEKMYTDRVANITAHWKADEQPELEKPIVFDEMLLKFSKNWRIEYSQYLTMLYGYKTPGEYSDQFAPMASRFNRVIKRIANGDNMTKNNLEAIEEMKQYYPDFEKHIDEIKKHKEELLAEEENGTVPAE